MNICIYLAEVFYGNAEKRCELGPFDLWTFHNNLISSSHIDY